MHTRWPALFPLLCAMGSVALSMIAIFAGSKPGYMEDISVVRLNTSMLGANLFGQLPDIPGIPHVPDIPGLNLPFRKRQVDVEADVVQRRQPDEVFEVPAELSPMSTNEDAEEPVRRSQLEETPDVPVEPAPIPSEEPIRRRQPDDVGSVPAELGPFPTPTLEEAEAFVQRRQRGDTLNLRSRAPAEGGLPATPILEQTKAGLLDDITSQLPLPAPVETLIPDVPEDIKEQVPDVPDVPIPDLPVPEEIREHIPDKVEDFVDKIPNVKEIVDKIDQAIPANIKNKLVGVIEDLKNMSKTIDFSDGIADELGINDWYSLHLMAGCEGTYTPSPVAVGAKRLVSHCTEQSIGYKLNITEILDRELGLGPFRINLADLDFPNTIQGGLNYVNDAIAIITYAYMLGCLCGWVVIIGSIAGFFMHTHRTLALAMWIVSLGGTLALLGGGLFTTLISHGAGTLIDLAGKPIGVAAEPGQTFVLITWASVLLMLTANIYWTVEFCVGRAKARVRRIRKRYEDELRGEGRLVDLEGGDADSVGDVGDVGSEDGFEDVDVDEKTYGGREK